MIKIYILIVLWGGTTSQSGTAVAPVEFTSLIKCQAASYEISKQASKKNSPPVMICAEK